MIYIYVDSATQDHDRTFSKAYATSNYSYFASYSANRMYGNKG